MKLKLVTGNKEKIREITYILMKYGIEVEPVILDLTEIRDGKLENISAHKAKQAYSMIKKPLLVDDTGLYFKAYKNFPGMMSKFLFNSIGFEGIFSLLKDKDRSAYYKSCITYISNRENLYTFTGILKGYLSKTVSTKFNHYFPYDSIFIPQNHENPRIEYTESESIVNSHRYRALKKFVKFLNKKV